MTPHIHVCTYSTFEDKLQASAKDESKDNFTHSYCTTYAEILYTTLYTSRSLHATEGCTKYRSKIREKYYSGEKVRSVQMMLNFSKPNELKPKFQSTEDS
ncbi:hypothetical protein FHG87_014577 [Trinorchestia longiramus]|nr:hypothetical protein FHG87_014577 [Trinorchestia longiramus]